MLSSGGRRHDPARKRANWSQRRKRVRLAVEETPHDPGNVLRAHDVSVLGVESPDSGGSLRKPRLLRKLKEVAVQLWSTDYAKLLADENSILSAMGQGY